MLDEKQYNSEFVLNAKNTHVYLFKVVGKITMSSNYLLVNVCAASNLSRKQSQVSLHRYSRYRCDYINTSISKRSNIVLI